MSSQYCLVRGTEQQQTDERETKDRLKIAQNARIQPNTRVQIHIKTRPEQELVSYTN